MKYMVFTTKHHDGFAMYDTKESDFKITSSNTPFSTNKRSDVTKEIFTAFRNEGFKLAPIFQNLTGIQMIIGGPIFLQKIEM